MTSSENLDICPFCNKPIPQGPAYFCPTCGKKLDEKYSKRQIILENTDILMDETDFEDSSIDELEDIASLIESNSSYSNDYISDDEILTEEIISSDNHISDENIEEESDLDDKIIQNDDSSEDSLKSQNNSIKLDLFLKNCVNENFAYGLLRYKNDDVDLNTDKDTLVNRVISNFDLKSIINFKYKYSNSELGNIFDSFIKPLKVVDVVRIAEKYDVKVSLSKEALKINFMEKFSPYDLILILNNEGLNIRDYTKISVLEQIYLLDDLRLEESSYKCPNIKKSRYEMISCIVTHYNDGFLISNNRLDIGEGAK